MLERSGTPVISPERLAKKQWGKLSREEELGFFPGWLRVPCRLENCCQRDHVLWWRREEFAYG